MANQIGQIERYTTLVKIREITNCITGDKIKFPRGYFVYDTTKECEVVIPNFNPASYEDIRKKADELNNVPIKSVCGAKMPCTCERALKADGFIDCDNSCKQKLKPNN